jgi:hypothetical protein
MTATHAATVCLFAGAGLMLGLVHFLGVRLSTRLYLEDGANLRAIGLHLLRVAATVVAFSLIAQAGALPLLAAFTGFLVGRIAVQRRFAGSP